MVTDKQVRRLIGLVKTEGNREIAAAKAGMDAKTARKYLRLGQVPSELPATPRWRTRTDPFERKPGAFAHYRYRDELFPTSRFRMAFDVLEERLGRGASREYLRILEMAAKESETKVDETLRTLLEVGEGEVTAEAINARLRLGSDVAMQEVQVAAVDLGQFDELCGAGEMQP